MDIERCLFNRNSLITSTYQAYFSVIRPKMPKRNLYLFALEPLNFLPKKEHIRITKCETFTYNGVIMNSNKCCGLNQIYSNVFHVYPFSWMRNTSFTSVDCMKWRLAHTLKRINHARWQQKGFVDCLWHSM